MNDTSPEVEDDKRPIAFISHHSSQEQTARHLKEILERNDIHGWMAPDDIEPGELFDKAIVEQVKRSDMIVLLFCAKSDQSVHVRRELTLAVDNKKLIFPVRLEDIDAEGLAYWLSGYQWIDWIDQRDETIQRLVDTIKHQAGGVGPGSSGQTVPPAAAVTRSKFGSRTALWAGGAAAIAIAGLGGGWYAWSGDNDLELKILSGSWARVLKDHAPVGAGVETAASEALFSSLAQTATGCIGAVEAVNPGISFFDLDGGNNCSMESFEPGENSKLMAEFICRPATLEGGSATFALDITPERNDKILAEGSLTIRDTTGAQSLYEVEFHYHYTGKNC